MFLPMNRTSGHFTGMLASLGLTAGIGAVFAASCCVLPLVIGGLGAGAGLFAVLEFLADYRIPVLVISAVLVATAWTLYFRGRGTRSIAIALGLASVLVVTAASWNLIELPLLKIVRANR